MIIIIGAGICGLYIGYQLLQKGRTDFLILEKSKEVGGRIYTTPDVNKLELGASIIHTNQKNIMHIIHQLGLTDDLFEIKGNNTFYCSSDSKKLDSEEIEQKLSLINQKLEKLSLKKGNLSLQELASESLDDNEYRFYRDYTREWYEYRDQNAYIVFKGWENTGRICKLKGGLSQIIRKFYGLLSKFIKLEYDVKNIERIGEGFLINDKIRCERIYLCTNYSGAKNIKYKNIGMRGILNLCKPISCLRVYVKFKNTVKAPDYLVSGKLFKFCIRITNRILMISYTDGVSADKINKMGEKRAVKTILNQISECIHQKLEEADIEKVYFAYWREGYDIIKSDISQKEYHMTLDSLPKNFIQTVCPLDFGLNQAWMEAHLLKI